MWFRHQSGKKHSSYPVVMNNGIVLLIIQKIIPVLLLVGGFGSSSVRAEEIQLNWGFNTHNARLRAMREDVLVFIYDPTHDVYSVPSWRALRRCDFNGATKVCSTSDSPCSVPLSLFGNESRVWFACSFHCFSDEQRLTVILPNGTDEYEYEYEYELT